LHRLVANRLFGLTFNILKNRQESEDALQETFVKIWKNAGRYHDSLGSPIGWLLTVTRNTAFDCYRKRARQAVQMENLQENMNEQIHSSQPEQADDRLLGVERKKKIREALATLGREQREAIELAFFTGHTQVEVSEKLGVPLGTVKARIRRGMQSLKPYLIPIS
jgi:RNA polymerase sigma-70 factor (ECF subfamily)